jgi:uncharacterized protein YegP (UPF0339 family)
LTLLGFHRQGGHSRQESSRSTRTSWRVPVPAEGGNGEVIAVGEGYKTKAGALNGIESIKKNAPDAAVVDQTES